MLRNIVRQIKQNVKVFELGHAEPLVISMLLSESDKTCFNMARTTMISHDILQRIISSGKTTIDELKIFLKLTAREYSDKISAGYLVVDDSALVKQFAKVFEGIGPVYDSVTKDTVNGYKIVLICWTNEKTTIPLGFKFWLPEAISLDAFKTKLELAKELVIDVKDYINFDAVLLDGLYASDDMMSFFEHHKIKYYMRLPRSRKIRAINASISFKVGDSIAFRLQKNARTGTFEAFFGNKKRFVTAQKRKKRNGDYETVYIVSNQKNEAVITILIYAIRWTIEKVFRTLKQTLGINDCRARLIEKQSIHIFSCMASYAILEQMKVNNNLNCPEDAFRIVLDIKRRFSIFENRGLINII